MDVPRVAIVSDDPLTRTGLAALLGVRRDLARAAGEPLAGLERLDESGADVALVDLEASHEVGAIAGRRFPIPAVVLIAHEAQAVDALEAGAHGVLLRNASADQLASALVSVHRGLLALDPALLRWIRPPPARGTSDAFAGLTPRESEVLALLAEGLSNKGIAARVGIAERTAKFHVESILAKLGAETRSEAIVLAARRGLVAL